MRMAIAVSLHCCIHKGLVNKIHQSSENHVERKRPSSKFDFFFVLLAKLRDFLFYVEYKRLLSKIANILHVWIESTLTR